MKQCCKLDKGNFYCLLFNARTPLNFLFELLCWETQMCVFICVYKVDVTSSQFQLLNVYHWSNVWRSLT